MAPEDNENVVKPLANLPPEPPPNPPNQPAANPIVNATPQPGANQVGVFITPQSLLTFSGSTAAVTTIWSVLGKINPQLANAKWLLIISFAMGLIIYIGTVSNSTNWRQKISEAGVALINTFTIAAAALGIGSVNSPIAPINDNNAPSANKSDEKDAKSFYKKTLSDGKEVSIIYREDEKPKLQIR